MFTEVIFSERKMHNCKTFLQLLFVSCILKYTGAQMSADAVYSMLAGKIDTLNDEMSFLRQVLMSTKSELTATKAELTSTQTELKSTQNKLMSIKDEVDTIKSQLGLGTGITTKATPLVSMTVNSTSTPYVDETCCQVVKKAIMNMKAEQLQANQNIENLIENKVALVSDHIERNTNGLLSMETEIDKLVTNVNGYKNVSEKKFANMRQHTNSLMDEMASNKLEMEKMEGEMKKFTDEVDAISRNLNNFELEMKNEMKDVSLKFSDNTSEQLKLNINLANVTWNLMELSRKHDKLAKNVETQKSQMSELVKSEMEMAGHCQSGRVVNSDRYKPHPATYTIKFKTPFRNIPVLTLGASWFDFYNGANLRVYYNLKEVSKTQAQVLVNVWANTIAYSYGFHWMACPT